eukprot:4337292-Pyramimonas_sp.AAC.1
MEPGRVRRGRAAGRNVSRRGTSTQTQLIVESWENMGNYGKLGGRQKPRNYGKTWGIFLSVCIYLCVLGPLEVWRMRDTRPEGVRRARRRRLLRGGSWGAHPRATSARCAQAHQARPSGIAAKTARRRRKHAQMRQASASGEIRTECSRYIQLSS